VGRIADAGGDLNQKNQRHGAESGDWLDTYDRIPPQSSCRVIGNLNVVET
jgi:hypothetical protein